MPPGKSNQEHLGTFNIFARKSLSTPSHRRLQSAMSGLSPYPPSSQTANTTFRNSMTSTILTESSISITILSPKPVSLKHASPPGIGVQALADTFMALRMHFDSPAGKELSIQIFEPIYHGARSLVQLGQFQYDLLGVTPTDLWDFAERDHRFKKLALACAYAVRFLDSMSVSSHIPGISYFCPFVS